MDRVLLATSSGCRTFTDEGEGEVELAGCSVSALTPDGHGGCLAIADGRDIWLRDAGGSWWRMATAEIELQSITSVGPSIYAGAMNEAAVLRMSSKGGEMERLAGFDKTPGRKEWFAGGPPLGVRSMTAALDGIALMAAVHVGGIPMSMDEGQSWRPTMPVMWDVHEVRAHPSRNEVVAAAAAVGVCISHDRGANWNAYTNGTAVPNALAVAVLEEEVLFSVQDGPFAAQSQIWRLRLADNRVEQVRDGLPEWLEGKVDTGCLASGAGRAALVDHGGNLWLSGVGSRNWKRLTWDAANARGVAIL